VAERISARKVGADVFASGAIDPLSRLEALDALGDDAASAKALSSMVAASDVRRVDVVAWRDLDDPEAGGSELHAHEVLSRWAAAGVDVRVWTSRVDGAPREIRRDGYRVTRRAGRYAVFARTAVGGFSGQIGTGDAVVEIWNGMPFLTPLWSRRPRVVFLHHVHAEMWQMVLSPRLAGVGNALEQRIAPPLYRSTSIVTLSESSKAEMVDRLRFSPGQVRVAPPGIDQRFTPFGAKEPTPLIVAVGRLVPVKRFDLLVEALVRIRSEHPTLRAVIVGEGYERIALEEQIRAADAEEWLSLPGRLDDTALVDLYRRAWMVASTSLREGWGMTLTEAAACGTPAVATRIAGHSDAVDDEVSGLLVDSMDELVTAAGRLIDDAMLRRRLSLGATRQAERFTWGATAALTFDALSDAVGRSRHRR
jgi:glycosyltransferase involved in cell wall biosynthesis